MQPDTKKELHRLLDMLLAEPPVPSWRDRCDTLVNIEAFAHEMKAYLGHTEDGWDELAGYAANLRQDIEYAPELYDFPGRAA